MRTLPLIFTIIAGVCVFNGKIYAQQSFDEFNAKRQERFDKYKEKKAKDFAEFRRKRNEEFAKYLRNKWVDKNPEPLTPVPKDDTLPPVIVPEEDVATIPDNPVPIVIQDVIDVPIAEPQPQPVEPIEEIPNPISEPIEPSVTFTFFGTSDEVRFDIKNVMRLDVLNENAISEAWEILSGDSYTNLVHDCLVLRDKYSLCDWAYLEMLNRMAESIYGGPSNEATLLLAYVYCQSGYQMRMAIDMQKLHLLIGSRHQIFELSYFNIDGTFYYPYLPNGDKISKCVQICGASYPNEKPMSLMIPSSQEFDINYTDERVISSKRYPSASATIKANLNLMSFYSTYPTSMLDGNIMTRWAMYANTPMARDVAEQLYPQLRRVIEGKSQLEAVNILLNWVQTGFEYEYDDKIWGRDRAFFAEESLKYPYCDCEDRSILFTRLLRDILDMKCILVFYPGHLATAVKFDEPVKGDYILLNNNRYTICDPTYIGAPVGLTMPDMNNQSAQVILLK